MRRMKAFGAALLLFLLTAAISHLYVKNHVNPDSAVFCTLPLEEKGINRRALTENMREDSIPVFGSSEFQHGTDTAYHPANVFAGSDFHPMLIGAGYYQSLSHAITLASIEKSMQVRRAVLILSPQWFRKTGVVDQAYASRFSETHYAGMMANEKLSDETKQYISDRTQQLLHVDEKTGKRIQIYDHVLWQRLGSPSEKALETFWSAFLHERELFSTALLSISSSYRSSKSDLSARSAKTAEPDWTALLEMARQEGLEQNQNQFYIDDDYYKILEPYLPEKKNINSDADKGYQTGPEFEDLRCFLTVCRELDITPMLVLLPVNGYYYDYTGFPGKAREGYYARIKSIAEEFETEIADFSDQEYTPYFFEDRVHIGKKGWVMVNESLYRFYKEA